MSEKGIVQENWQVAKKWYQSKTIIGVIVAALGAIIQHFYPELGIDLPNAIEDVMSTADQIAVSADVGIGAVTEIIGLAFAFYGRLKVKQPISRLDP